jgi:Metal-dependent hydrolases of the beta-lactamase superfamily III
MKPLVHATLVNADFGDPGLFLDFMFESRAILFDLGDIHALPARKLLRLSHVFVSHAHMDHFSGFDHLLRTLLGREGAITLFGPPGFIAQVEHKLSAYTWNLVKNYPTDFTFVAVELDEPNFVRRAYFRCRTGFSREDEAPSAPVPDGAVLSEAALQVRATTLDHGTPCLAFALDETHHVNIHKARLLELGFNVGPWLRELKAAVLRGDPDDTPVQARWREQGEMA